MTEWLFKEEEYIPKEDQDEFIDKTVFSILTVLSKIKRGNVKNNNFIYKINPCIKLLTMISMVLFISLSKTFLYIFAVDAYLLFWVSSLHKEEIKKILIGTLVGASFTLVMLLPSIFMGNEKNSFMIFFKVMGTIMAVNLLSYTTPWHEITKVLKTFFIPDVFILIMDLTLQYIVLLGEFSLELLYALKLRSVGKNNRKFSAVSRIMGTLFIKSKEMGDEVYAAMECRGFTGEYSSKVKNKFYLQDYVFGVGALGMIFLYFYIGGDCII